MKKTLISIVIPCFNEEENISEVYKALLKVIRGIPKYEFEFVFVDNGSLDRTRDLISSLVKKDKRVRGVYLSRNFGPESSTQAGLDYAKGRAIIIYESDMQDPPELIRSLIKKWEEGYEVVAGVRNKIEDTPVMAFFRKSFYRIFRAISDIDVPVNSGHYGLIGKKALDAMKKLPEKYRFYRGIRAWIGFKTAYITYERKKRRHGKSSYNFFSYIKHAERSVFGFSYLPLDILIYFGLLLVFLSFLFIVGYVSSFFFFGNSIQGNVAILVTIVFFGGVNLLAVSIIGKYIQVIVEETKSRPTYIIDSVEERT
jgi:dolichol-phosphate mannosyltransferase